MMVEPGGCRRRGSD